MSRTTFLLTALVWGIPLCAQQSPSPLAPVYTAATVVNTATASATALAPNTLATINGQNLTPGFTGSCPDTGYLPLELDGVHVFVAGSPAPLYYVSPGQINFVIPAELLPGETEVFISEDGLAGPMVRVNLLPVGPGLLPSQPGVVTATHSDGSLVTKTHPAIPGETVTLSGTGFGPTSPAAVTGMGAATKAPITAMSEFRVLVNGTAIPRSSVEYAGAAIGTPGVYSVTFTLPKHVANNPLVRVAIGTQYSQPNLRLPLQ